MNRWIALVFALLAAPALAQDGPQGEDDIVWSTFVGGPGRSPSRQSLDASPGQIRMTGSPWRCGFARARFAQIAPHHWSVQRVLACRRGDATVSATASCRVHQGQVEERAATLSLGSIGDSSHIAVTLSCRSRS